MRSTCIRGTGILAAGLSVQLALAQTSRVQTPASVDVYFTADVQADGVPINIQPDPNLTPALQAMVRKRVTQWRYQVGSWQGKPVPMPVSQKIEAEVIPVSDGGFELKIKKVSGVPIPDGMGPVKNQMRPPAYPLELLQRAVSGTLIYAFRVDAQGRPYDVELLAPDNLNRDMKALERSARTAMMSWVLATPRVDGVALDCRFVTPIDFLSGSNYQYKKTDLAPYRARLSDACPAPPELVTEVAGTVL